MIPDRSKGSWIALYTRTLSSEDFLRLTCVERAVFLQALLLAARVEYDALYDGRHYHLLPGQFVITQRDLAKLCGDGCTRKIVRRTIDKLIACHSWAHQRAHQGAHAPSLITFIKWGSYQLLLTDRAHDRANRRDIQGPTGVPLDRINGSENDALHGSNTDNTQGSTQTRKEPPTPKTSKKATAYTCSFDYAAGSWVMTDCARARLEHNWPDIDLEIELKKAAAWALDHAAKPVKNGLSFLARWLAKPDCVRKKGIGIEQDFYGKKYRISYDDAQSTELPFDISPKRGKPKIPDALKDALEKVTLHHEDDD